MQRGIALGKKSDELERRAAAVGSGGVSSDDPDAVAKLREEVTKLEAQQEVMKTANKYVRKNDRAGLSKLGFSEKQISNLFTPDYMGRIGFPNYAITNNGANIRRIKQRINDLEVRAKEKPIEPIVGAGWTIREDVEDNRILVEFDQKPSREILDALRTNGFKWSPTRGAHVRMRSDGALWRAKRILDVV